MRMQDPERSPSLLDFHKVEGLGNDFILLDWRQRQDVALGLTALQAHAPRLCDRRRGIGGDGILVVTAAAAESPADAAMVVINHDGSRPEMCGNGLRCVALYLDGVAGLGAHLTIDTGAGALRCETVLEDPGSGDAIRGEVTIAMGPARDLGERRPTAAAGRVFRAISTGNPHAITFVEPHEDPEALARALGPAIERDPLFPGRTNVEFAKLRGDGGITLWVWERGCGITEACGTGACATAPAAVREGRAQFAHPLPIRLPGGWLTIEVPEDPEDSVMMSGPARLVFRGQIPDRPLLDERAEDPA